MLLFGGFWLFFVAVVGFFGLVVWGFFVWFSSSFTEYQFTRLRDHCPGQGDFTAHYDNLQCLFSVLFFQVKQFSLSLIYCGLHPALFF